MAEKNDISQQSPEASSQGESRVIPESFGHSGVSDRRRAELSQLERDAGVQHEAADEAVPSKPANDLPASGDRSDSAKP